MDLKEKRQRVLDETIEYYSEDTNRRCINHHGGCYYSPRKAEKEGISEGCAVGRLLPEELKNSIDKLTTSNEWGGIDSGVIEIFELLPSDVQELGESFLMDLQELHDGNEFWNQTKGLSEEGIKRAQEIRNRWSKQ